MAKINPLIKEATALGWEVRRGSKHWKLFHRQSNQTTILPYGSKFSDRDIKNIRSRLKRTQAEIISDHKE